MKPLIKWPGGKSSEIQKIEHLIPEYDRYIEPFFGGGALFFYLKPNLAIINDISNNLIEYYSLLKSQDDELHKLLVSYNDSFHNIIKVCEEQYSIILDVYDDFKQEKFDKTTLNTKVKKLVNTLFKDFKKVFDIKLLPNEKEFCTHLVKNVADKIVRTVKNDNKKAFSSEDLKSSLITGFTSGYYMYYRKIYNDLNLNKIESPSTQFQVANFYFIREYCYGSMFRYNANGEFNIPYGGISYNKKNFKNKIDNMYNNEISNVLKNTDIHCLDFAELFKNIGLTSNDFMFLDPPYDTEFSNYNGIEFTQDDQKRLADELCKTLAKFILVIKNTEFIYSLYENKFNILSFDNQYVYNVKGRNQRDVEHLIITNLPIEREIDVSKLVY